MNKNQLSVTKIGKSQPYWKIKSFILLIWKLNFAIQLLKFAFPRALQNFDKKIRTNFVCFSLIIFSGVTRKKVRFCRSSAMCPQYPSISLLKMVLSVSNLVLTETEKPVFSQFLKKRTTCWSDYKKLYCKLARHCQCCQ